LIHRERDFKAPLTVAHQTSREVDFSVNAHATDPRMIDALQGASSLQLYQLKAMIEGMLADPRRGFAARANLHLGQSVRFVDFRDGQMRSGKIIAMKDIQATVLEQGTKRTWKIPCVAMQGYTDANLEPRRPHMNLRQNPSPRQPRRVNSKAVTPSRSMIATSEPSPA